MSGRAQALKTNTINLPPNLESYAIELFGEKYYQIVKIYRAQDSDSAQKYTWYLYNDYIEKIELVSDIMTPVLNGSMIFIDKGNRLFQRIPHEDARTYMDVTIIKMADSGTEVQNQFTHTFLVNDLEQISKSHSQTQYEVHLISIDWFQFNNFIDYASRGVKPFTEMIEAIFKKMELNFESIKNTPKNLIQRSGYYVTPTNNTAYKSINDLMNKCVHPDIGFFFLKYSMSENTYSLVSPKLEFKKDANDYDLDNIINLPTEEMVGFVPRTANNITEKNYLDANTNLNKLKGVQLNYFDYDLREWKDVSYNPNQIFTDLMPIAKGNVLETKFKPIDIQLKQDVRRESIEHLFRDFAFRGFLTEIFTQTDSIQFECYGVTKRSAGDMIVLFCPDNHPLHKKYSGLWMITRVFHRIVKKEYINVIQACRVHQYKDAIRINDVQEG